MQIHRIDLGSPTLLAFRGPDAVRFLNGQLTQDVRLVVSGERCLPSCVTDAKGRLQFRVWIAGCDGDLWIEAGNAEPGELEARLTRYLIADDAEASSLTGRWRLVHFTGPPGDVPAGVIARACARFGSDGCDWWIPAGQEPDFPHHAPVLAGDALETFRIARGVPGWGSELTAGLLPPEAGLDATDISYQKGCYIGQEVISRIKSVGRVNRCLRRLAIDAALGTDGLELIGADGGPAGEITSVSPHAEDGLRHVLAFVKRGATEPLEVRVANGAGDRGHPDPAAPDP